MYRYVITESPHGYEVHVNLINSSAGRYISQNPHMLSLMTEVLKSVDLTESSMVIERDMGRVIGNSNIVETTEKDTIYYAMPTKKSGFTRFAKNRGPAPSSKLSIFLQKDADGHYEVIDTWVGPYSPPFPVDDTASVKSKTYWDTHALAQDAYSVQSKTITKVCPY